MLYEGSIDVSGYSDDEIQSMYVSSWGPFDRASMTVRDVLATDPDVPASSFIASMRPCRDVSSAGSSRRGSHRLKVFAECPQKFAYASVLKLVPLREPEGRARGALLHLGLMHRYLRMLGFDVSEPLETMRAAPARIAYTFEDCRRLYEAYDHHYQHEQLDIVAVEKEYAIRVGDYVHTARFDLVWRQNGRTFVVDHKCLPVSSVLTTRAGPTTVGSLIGQSTELVSCVESSRLLEWKPTGPVVSAGVQSVWAVATKLGQHGRFGHTHPLMTQRGWTAAAEIRPGDFVAVGLDIPDSADVPVSDAAIWAMGSLICDGGYGPKSGGVIYTKTHPVKRARFIAAINQLVPDGCVECFPLHRAPYVRVRRPAFLPLQLLGLPRAISADKRVPRVLMGMSIRQTGLLIGAFWEGDGCASTGAENGKRKLRLVYTSRSRGLCFDIQWLLNRLGLLATVVESSVMYKGARRPYWHTTVVGRQSKCRFLDLIERGVIDAPVLRERVPDLRDVLTAKRLSGHDPLHEGGIVWDRVESALYVGCEPCYDIEVVDNHTLLADGFVTHNTSSQPAHREVRAWSSELQFLGAELIGRAHWGDSYGGIVINAIGTKDLTFARGKLNIDASLLPVASRSIEWLNGQIHRQFATLADPWNYPRTWACQGRYGRCEFEPLCLRGTHELNQYQTAADSVTDVEA